jgi:predicted nucleic acid-binding protein
LSTKRSRGNSTARSGGTDPPPGAFYGPPRKPVSFWDTGGLSVADAWIAATAVHREALLVHKDPEFARAGHVEQEHLPN